MPSIHVLILEHNRDHPVQCLSGNSYNTQTYQPGWHHSCQLYKLVTYDRTILIKFAAIDSCIKEELKEEVPLGLGRCHTVITHYTRLVLTLRVPDSDLTTDI